MDRKRAVIDYRVFTRVVSRRKRFYIRFLYNGKVFLTRATDAPTIAKAGAIAAQIMEHDDLEALAKAKELKQTKALDEIDRLSQIPVVEFLRFFWNPECSPYLSDVNAAGKPLSGSYIRDMRRNVEKFFAPVALFAEIPIHELRLKHIDSLFRNLRVAGKSRSMLNSIRRTIQTPCNWLAVRNGMQKINFAAIVMPKEMPNERGILTIGEVEKILNLETTSLWQDSEHKLHVSVRARNRLPHGQKNEGEPEVGWREKLIIVLGALTGMRVGEMRALQWKYVDFQNGIIHIVANYTNLDGLKAPKARSKRDVQIGRASCRERV
jgi:site-specific recombinase XerC